MVGQTSDAACLAKVLVIIAVAAPALGYDKVWYVLLESAVPIRTVGTKSTGRTNVVFVAVLTVFLFLPRIIPVDAMENAILRRLEVEEDVLGKVAFARDRSHITVMFPDVETLTTSALPFSADVFFLGSFFGVEDLVTVFTLVVLLA